MTQPEDKKQSKAKAITDTANRIGMLMVDAVNGTTGEKITWDAAVFAAGLAIRAMASHVMEKKKLSESETSALVQHALRSAFEGDVSVKEVDRDALAPRPNRKAH